jgi:hypothetical protein
MEKFKNVDWSNLDASSPYSGVTAQAMGQNELRKGGFDPYGWSKPAFGQDTSLLGDITNKIKTGPEGLAAVQEQLKPQPTPELKPFGGVTAQAAGQNELRKGGVDPYASMGDTNNPNNQLLTSVTNEIKNTGSADGAGALVNAATSDPNNLLTSAQPYRPGGAKDPTEVISPPLGGDPDPLAATTPLGSPVLAATTPAGGGMATQGGANWYDGYASGADWLKDNPQGGGESTDKWDNFMSFMTQLQGLQGLFGGGGGGYGYPSMGYGGYAPGGMVSANPYGNMMNFMNAFKNTRSGSGGASDAQLTTGSLNQG